MNNRLRVTELDFDSIKTNLKTFLKQQSEFEDYDFEGSGINILLDILAYNTHYNAYYLNMIANESFLDSSILRSSVVSHAKKYGYVPKSRVAPKAVVNIQVDGTLYANSTLTLPKNYLLLSDSIDRISYNFVTLEERTVEKVANTFTFSNVEIYEGRYATFSYNYNEQTNPKQIFDIPDRDVDLSTLKVSVQQSTSNTYTTVYKKAEEVIEVKANSEIYYLQESQTGKYQIYFGDGVLGKKIPNGSVLNLQYLVTQGSAGNRANNFVVSTTISNLSAITVNSVQPASGGAERESIDSIKYSAPLQFISQNRAVTKNDYIRLILEKYEGFDAVNVWGGEENIPPVFGKVFVSAKPKLGFELTNTEKEFVKQEILKPISILTVNPEIVDVDYNYLKVESKVYYNPTATTLTESDLKTGLTQMITAFCNEQLNKFNSYFRTSSLISKVDNYNASIISNEINLFVGKKFRPDILVSRSYVLDYGFSLQKGDKERNFETSPKFIMLDETGVPRDCFFEEIPSSYSGIESIDVVNPGINYTEIPTIEIVGDGTGANAVAEIVNGRISRITVTNPGVGYTTAVVRIINDRRDTTGSLAQANAITEGRYGQIRIAYFKPDSISNQNIKFILNSGINGGATGIIDYLEGKVYINNFRPFAINDNFGTISVFVRPQSNVIRSIYNKMLVIDSSSSSSISVRMVRS